MSDNIVLIGMPGAGKSTVGVVLAKKLGMQFVDSDLLIQDKESRLLHTIIEEDGLSGFLKIEEEVNANLMYEKAVIATGGSAVYSKKAMEHLAGIGTVVYLKLSYDNIVERLGDLQERGVAMQNGQTLKALYDERVPLYEKYADVIIMCDNKMIREIVADIVSKRKIPGK